MYIVLSCGVSHSEVIEKKKKKCMIKCVRFAARVALRTLEILIDLDVE